MYKTCCKSGAHTDFTLIFSSPHSLNPQLKARHLVYYPSSGKSWRVSTVIQFQGQNSALALGDTSPVITDTDKLSHLLLKKDFLKAFYL